MKTLDRRLLRVTEEMNAQIRVMRAPAQSTTNKFLFYALLKIITILLKKSK